MLILALTLINCANAGGFLWPNVEYDHAKVYLLNIPFEGPENLDWHVFEDDAYALSKAGDGYELNEALLSEFHGILARGVDELYMGLSKCFIPRHGIIYFDKDGNPVASTTICFECDRIEFWSINELNLEDHPVTKFDFDRAEQQMKNIKSLFKSNDIPVFDEIDQYEALVTNGEEYQNQGEISFEMEENDTLFKAPFKVGDVWLWVNPKMRPKKEFEEVNEIKFNNGGEKFIFKKFTDHKGSDFIYSTDEFPNIIEATIYSKHIILPNGVSIGMSLEQVQSTFAIWDGIANPNHITVYYKAYQVDYYFEKRTLTKITLRSR